MTRPPLPLCVVAACQATPRWRLDDENGDTWLVCGTHLDSWTTHLYNRARICCQQSPYQRPPTPKPRKAHPQPTLF
jgi:hypothetical protein